jgi:hypothetical protein
MNRILSNFTLPRESLPFGFRCPIENRAKPTKPNFFAFSPQNPGFGNRTKTEPKLNKPNGKPFAEPVGASWQRFPAEPAHVRINPHFRSRIRTFFRVGTHFARRRAVALFF